MARSEVTVTDLTAYNSESTITKDAVDTTNNHSIDVSDVPDQKLQVYLETTTAPLLYEIKAGDFLGNGAGDLSISVTSAGTEVVMLESARFKDTDELILIDVSTTGSGAGTIYATKGV